MHFRHRSNNFYFKSNACQFLAQVYNSDSCLVSGALFPVSVNDPRLRNDLLRVEWDFKLCSFNPNLVMTW